MKAEGTSKNWGGVRPGSDVKKVAKKYSEKVKKNWLDAAKKIAAETGKTIEEHCLRLLIDKKFQSAVKVAAVKLYNEALLVKESEQTIIDNRRGPVIGLPPIKEKPVVVPGEKSAEKEERVIN